MIVDLLAKPEWLLSSLQFGDAYILLGDYLKYMKMAPENVVIIIGRVPLNHYCTMHRAPYLKAMDLHVQH